jgi:predicted HAD superfamily Cof-like phosphohydrolase
MNTKDDVQKFMLAAGQRVTDDLKQNFDGQVALYYDLIKEELFELAQAYRNFDKVECADACADLIWVIEGFCHSLGIPLQKVWNEVARSNHSKISDEGKIIKRNDGKILKPDTYSPPDIRSIIEK